MKKYYWIILSLLLIIPQFIYGNESQYLFIVPGAEKKLELYLKDEKGNKILGERHDKFLESYFVFPAEKEKKLDLSYRYNDIEYSLPISSTDKTIVYSLELNTNSLIVGKKPFRTFGFQALRISLVMFLKFAIFYLFKYREKKSYWIFLISNIIIQSILFYYLQAQVISLHSKFYIGLVITSLIGTAVEILTSINFIKEYKTNQNITYAIIGNFSAFILNFMFLKHLPF